MQETKFRWPLSEARRPLRVRQSCAPRRWQPLRNIAAAPATASAGKYLTSVVLPLSGPRDQRPHPAPRPTQHSGSCSADPHDLDSSGFAQGTGTTTPRDLRSRGQERHALKAQPGGCASPSGAGKAWCLQDGWDWFSERRINDTTEQNLGVGYARWKRGKYSKGSNPVVCVLRKRPLGAETL